MTLITGVLRLLTTWGLICIQGALLNKSGNILGYEHYKYNWHHVLPLSHFSICSIKIHSNKWIQYISNYNIYPILFYMGVKLGVTH
jgi:hypothetical protein